MSLMAWLEVIARDLVCFPLREMDTGCNHECFSTSLSASVDLNKAMNASRRMEKVVFWIWLYLSARPMPLDYHIDRPTV